MAKSRAAVPKVAKVSLVELGERFVYLPPSDEGRRRHAELGAAFVDLALLVNRLVPEGREKSLVFTKLEEAKFWASAGVARNGETR